MAKAEQAILAECEDALQATVIVDKLKQLRDQAVELKRQGKMDASSVQGEVDKLKDEIVPPRRRGSKTSITLTSAGCPRPSSPSRSRRRRCRPSRWWTRCSHGSTR